jgi:hypothetical protein
MLVWVERVKGGGGASWGVPPGGGRGAGVGRVGRAYGRGGSLPDNLAMPEKTPATKPL